MKKDKRNELKKLEDDFIAPEKRPLIPERKYEAQCIKVDKHRSHSRSKKIFLKFKIFDGINFDNSPILFMAMNDPGDKVPVGTKYYENWVIANGNKVPARKDRMPLKVFLNGMFEVHVGTVKPKFPDGEEKPDCFHYSIVRYIKRKLTNAN